MMQEPEVVENIKKHYKFVDIVFGTHNIFKFAAVSYTHLDVYKRQVVDNVAYIDQEKCTGCGICAEKCPKKIIL